ncbi:MAG: dTDP-4-dehydrorhamnose reductase [Bacteroidota bacterium]|nr:dTDP-4-dehydrorhamnose reductase [Bacteroidota bacterium]
MENDSQKKELSGTSSGAGDIILVTGANGQLGMELQSLSVSYPQYNFVFLSRTDLPVENKEMVHSLFEKYRPQYCINCAAYTAVDKAESEKDMAFRVNTEGTASLAAICSAYNTKFIHISTDYVFDGTASVPYREDNETNPQSVYGASKLAGEKQVMRFNKDAVIIRTSWVYSEFGKNFVKTMLKLMNEKEEINVVSDQIGSPTYAADLAETILQIIVRFTTHHSPLTTDSGIYHFSNKGAISWYDFALAIKELSGSKCRVNPILTSQYPTPAKRPAYSVLDKTKIQQTFGIVVKDWKESLAACIRKIQKIS